MVEEARPDGTPGRPEKLRIAAGIRHGRRHPDHGFHGPPQTDDIYRRLAITEKGVVAMMKHEFEKLIGNEISEDDWELVHTVYQWYPEIDDVKGKAQVAQLWLTFGKRIIVDMLPRATEIMEYELKMQSLNLEKEKIRQALNRL